MLILAVSLALLPSPPVVVYADGTEAGRASLNASAHVALALYQCDLII